LPTLHPLWRAKNVRNDEYNLTQPVWISDLHFLDEQRRGHDAGYRVVVCTRFYQIRVYDTSISRRPIINVEVGSSPIVSMTLGWNDSEVLVADSHGRVTSFSLDKRVANGNFVGPTGSILSMDIQKSYGKTGMLACVGLDRFLRLYDMSSRASLGKVYCKTKMTSVLIIDESGSVTAPGPESSKRKLGRETVANSTGDEDNNALWSQLPKADNPENASIKRRRFCGQVARSKEE